MRAEDAMEERGGRYTGSEGEAAQEREGEREREMIKIRLRDLEKNYSN